MNIKEAKTIVKYILDWHFVLMGVKKRNEITEIMDLSKYSLSDLIHASKLVESNNRRKENLQKYHSGKGHKSKGYTISMILDDRIIAAVYTTMHFHSNGEGVALLNDVVVGCVVARYEEN